MVFLWFCASFFKALGFEPLKNRHPRVPGPGQAWSLTGSGEPRGDRCVLLVKSMWRTENHGKTIGKWWFYGMLCDFMGFATW